MHDYNDKQDKKLLANMISIQKVMNFYTQE